MATLLELQDMTGGGTSDLRKKILAAITIKANAIVNLAAPNAAQRAFALAALENPARYEEIVLRTALASNSSLTVLQIQSASDAAIQATVDNVVDKLLAV